MLLTPTPPRGQITMRYGTIQDWRPMTLNRVDFGSTQQSGDHVALNGVRANYAIPLEQIPQHFWNSQQPVRVEIRDNRIQGVVVPRDQVLPPHGQITMRHDTYADWQPVTLDLVLFGSTQESGEHVMLNCGTERYAIPLEQIPQHLQNSQQPVRVEIRDNRIQGVVPLNQALPPRGQLTMRYDTYADWNPATSNLVDFGSTQQSGDHVMLKGGRGTYAIPLEQIPRHLWNSEQPVRVEIRDNRIHGVVPSDQVLPPRGQITVRYDRYADWQPVTSDGVHFGSTQQSGEHVMLKGSRGTYAIPLEQIPRYLQDSQKPVRIETRNGRIHDARLDNSYGNLVREEAQNPIALGYVHRLGQEIASRNTSITENFLQAARAPAPPIQSTEDMPDTSISELAEKYPRLKSASGEILTITPSFETLGIIVNKSYHIPSELIHNHIPDVLASDTPRVRSSTDNYGYHQPGGYGTETQIIEGSTMGDRGATRDLPLLLAVRNGKVDIHSSINVDTLRRTLDPEYNRITVSRARGEGWKPEELQFANREKYLEHIKNILDQGA